MWLCQGTWSTQQLVSGEKVLFRIGLGWLMLLEILGYLCDYLLTLPVLFLYHFKSKITGEKCKVLEYKLKINIH